MKKARLFVWSEGLDEISSYCGDLDSLDSLDETLKGLTHLIRSEIEELGNSSKNGEEVDASIVLTVKYMTDEEVAALPII